MLVDVHCTAVYYLFQNCQNGLLGAAVGSGFLTGAFGEGETSLVGFATGFFLLSAGIIFVFSPATTGAETVLNRDSGLFG